jgi:hypothetical protein
MADLSLDVRDYQSKIRTYFPTALPKNVKLVDIKDLGDSGLMTVVDGELGVIVARKGRSCPLRWCNWRRVTAIAGMAGQVSQPARAGRLTAGSSLKGAMVSSVM